MDHLNLMANENLLKEQFGLSKAEINVLGYVVEGFQHKETAVALCVTEKTVKYHMTAIYKKTSCRNRVELVNKIHSLF